MKKNKKLWNMTTEELAQATKEFDQEHVADSFREMTPEEEAAWAASVRKRSRARSRLHTRVKVVCLDIEAGLLRRVDALAKKRGISRARLITEGLERLLPQE